MEGSRVARAHAGTGDPTPGRWLRRSYAVLLVLVGLALSAGGVVLAAEGGSAYYLIAGLAVLASAALLWRSDRRGAWIFGAMLVGTVGWAVWEVGFSPWLLLPRLVAPFALALGLLLPGVRRTPLHAPVTRAVGGWTAFGGGVVVAVLVGAILNAAGPGQRPDPLWQTGDRVTAPGRLPRPLAAVAGGEWGAYGNDQGGTRFSPLDDIDVGNVGRLQVAWQAETGPAPAGASTGGLEATPIMVGDGLYVCNGYDTVIAFDAETGKERWRFAMTDSSSGKPCRG